MYRLMVALLVAIMAIAVPVMAQAQVDFAEYLRNNEGQIQQAKVMDGFGWNRTIEVTNTYGEKVKTNYSLRTDEKVVFTLASLAPNAYLVASSSNKGEALLVTSFLSAITMTKINQFIGFAATEAWNLVFKPGYKKAARSADVRLRAPVAQLSWGGVKEFPEKPTVTAWMRIPADSPAELVSVEGTDTPVKVVDLRTKKKEDKKN